MRINPASTAKVGTHPLHPMLIPFPVAFLVGAFVTDLAFIGTGDGFWARASIWLLGAGIVMALVAALAGFTALQRASHPGAERCLVSHARQSHRGRHCTRQLPAPVRARCGSCDQTMGRDSVARGRWHPAVHGLEGLGDGLLPSRGRSGRSRPDQFGAGDDAPWRLRTAGGLASDDPQISNFQSGGGVSSIHRWPPRWLYSFAFLPPRTLGPNVGL